MINITIDGKQIQVAEGTTIIQAIDQNGMDLPRYCYHPGLSIAGNCRICQVEIEKAPKTVIACNTKVTEGMVIYTRSPKAKESQQVVLEYLLANHPLDCPVCDQSGECKLQDYYMDYGLYSPKFDDPKVKKTKKAFPIGPTIMLDQERCILCSRCVRFCDEITRTHELGIFNRGNRAEVDLGPGKVLDNPYSGNLADVCPVGALTDRDFRFKLRVWYLGSQESVCPGCARGCNTYIHYERSRPYPLKTQRVMRLKPRENPAVNQWWMCDGGRYAYPSIDKERNLFVRIRKSGVLLQTDWQGGLDAAAKLICETKGSWGLLISAQLTNEELYLSKRLFVDFLKWKSVGFRSRLDFGVEDDFLIKKDKNPNAFGVKALLGLDETSIDSVLQDAEQRPPEGLFVFAHDLDKILGTQRFKQLRSKIKNIIFVGPQENATALASDVLLPSACYAEIDGTFTNFEGRVQRIRKALEPTGSARPLVEILQGLEMRLGERQTMQATEEVFAELAKQNAFFSGLNYDLLGHSGRLGNNGPAAAKGKK